MKPIIDLSKPTSVEFVKDFPRPRAVFKYTCDVCKNIVCVKAASFLGKRAVPSKGAIYCPYCHSKSRD